MVPFDEAAKKVITYVIWEKKISIKDKVWGLTIVSITKQYKEGSEFKDGGERRLLMALDA